MHLVKVGFQNPTTFELEDRELGEYATLELAYRAAEAFHAQNNAAFIYLNDTVIFEGRCFDDKPEPKIIQISEVNSRLALLYSDGQVLHQTIVDGMCVWRHVDTPTPSDVSTGNIECSYREPVPPNF